MVSRNVEYELGPNRTLDFDFRESTITQLLGNAYGRCISLNHASVTLPCGPHTADGLGNSLRNDLFEPVQKTE